MRTAHGLGGTNYLMMAYFECLTADNGYSVGIRYINFVLD